jgi:hypothetical protein
MTDLTAGRTAGRDRALRERNRQPERLAHSALLTLDPDRAGLDPRLQGRNYLLPNVAASAAERASHVARFSPDALALFGPDVLEATAKIKDSKICRWCFAGATANVSERPTPHVRVAARQPGERTRVRTSFETLLGKPCPACQEKLTAAAARCDALRLRRRTPATSSAVTASALAGRSPAELQRAMDRLTARVHGTRSTRRTDRYGTVNPGAYAGKSLVDVARQRGWRPAGPTQREPRAW